MATRSVWFKVEVKKPNRLGHLIAASRAEQQGSLPTNSHSAEVRGRESVTGPTVDEAQPRPPQPRVR